MLRLIRDLWLRLTGRRRRQDMIRFGCEAPPGRTFNLATILQNCDPQAGSAFFARLPLEVRLQIYRLVMPPESLLYVTPDPRRRDGIMALRRLDAAGGIVTGIRTQLFWHIPRHIENQWSLCERFAGSYPWVIRSWFQESTGAPIYGDCIEFLGTCKRFYVEASQIFTYAFSSVQYFQLFAETATSLPIHSIQVDAGYSVPEVEGAAWPAVATELAASERRWREMHAIIAAELPRFQNPVAVRLAIFARPMTNALEAELMTAPALPQLARAAGSLTVQLPTRRGDDEVAGLEDSNDGDEMLKLDERGFVVERRPGWPADIYARYNLDRLRL